MLTRTWVNPNDNKASGHCSKDETVALAVRAQKMGMRVMIDFHYSDSRADPGKQVKPKAWEGLNFEQLKKALYNYTFDVTTALQKAGVTPEWVQVGNETRTGMIYPEGNTDNWSQLAQLINSGYEAVKAVSPTTKVILHVDQGNNKALFKEWFDAATKYGAKYDVIGMSYYPYWLNGHPDYTLSIDDLGQNLKDVASNYHKEVMVVEVGGEDSKIQNTYDMLKAVIKKVKEVPDNKGLGVFYWEPEGARSWSYYGLSAWGDDGKPTKALNAFNDITEVKNYEEKPVYAKWDEQSQCFVINKNASKLTLYNLAGMIIGYSQNSNYLRTDKLPIGIYLLKIDLSASTNSFVLKVIKP